MLVTRAVDIGSAEGLETLSIGRLASEAGMSKSGVAGQFGSKQRLQLAAVEAANERFREEVWEPVAFEPEGLPRLRAVMESWISYLEREVFPGGCFLTAAAIEYDDRPGPVRDAIAESWACGSGCWRARPRRPSAPATSTRRPTPTSSPSSYTALCSEATSARQLLGGPDPLAPSRTAVARILGAAR